MIRRELNYYIIYMERPEGWQEDQRSIRPRHASTLPSYLEHQGGVRRGSGATRSALASQPRTVQADRSQDGVKRYLRHRSLEAHP